MSWHVERLANKKLTTNSVPSNGIVQSVAYVSLRCRSGKARWGTNKKLTTNSVPSNGIVQSVAYVSCAAGPARPGGELRRNSLVRGVPQTPLAGSATNTAQ